ncbi:MAG: lamin tail domain-containing protein [Candidatus Cloacimonetes bacterium]|nr:lamin tail domain-containing protein [Candidatus Cloacimonadota bacterium]
MHFRCCFIFLLLGGLISLLFPILLDAEIVINEVCYDPQGPDSGYEWIELYNNGNEDINLQGAKILCGGRTFQLVYELPSFILRAHRFLLIGESQITQAQLITPLGFQNGGAETDGIRYVSPDGTYTDTILYDSPNTNQLPDDTGVTGSAFAPDVPEGYSLARIIDGLDTNNCELDFLSESHPTPGFPNHRYIDYALLAPEVYLSDDFWYYQVVVKNISLFSTNETADLNIFLDEVSIAEYIIPEIAPDDSLMYEGIIPLADDYNHLVKFVLTLADDPDLSNNQYSTWLWEIEPQLPVINEIMYNPQTGLQEWIEIWAIDAASGNYTLKDQAENQCSFSLPASSGYFILCPNSDIFISQYPSCPASSVLQSSGWTLLNNDEDSLYLFDEEQNLLDQMSYVGDNSHKGISLERYLTESQEPRWRYCLNELGSTPGNPNSQAPSIPPFSGNFHLTGSPCNPQKDEQINLYYKLDPDQSYVHCYIYDRQGRKVRVLADNLMVSSEGILTWDGKDSSGKYLSRGLYFISWKSKAINGGKILNRQFSVVLYY